MKKLMLTFLIGAPLLLTSCHKNNFCIKGDENISSEVRTIEGFSKIKLSTLANVQFVQDSIVSLTIEASEKLIPYIRTNVVGDVLEITTKNNTCIRGKNSLTVYVTGPNLSDINLSGSGNVMVSDLLNSNKMNIKISGSGNVDMENLVANDLTTNISGSGNIYISSTDTLVKNAVKISGSGDVNLSQAITHQSNINISGSGKCKVNVIDELDVKISGSGDVYYTGNPEVDVDITGSGSLKHD
ncbi:hypothetical protein DNU06_01930 [Putridiphycobacter roseus]|uniref:Putative auto-transporter adhesin head GIN domain-containing protein n=1 Tax=Putridiphycobacter roseus TaxID=2219161 RepID=A0A2W1N442_9FLAO|nr:head GIN domain-containing protein [Putridiphycobacter roseus]PZE18614.1 hypothetical protein DNU06_01930 [Putridiphycobacter roseus]